MLVRCAREPVETGRFGADVWVPLSGGGVFEVL
jgi:hypothetical protein